MARCTSIQTPSFNQKVPPDGFDASGNLLKFERKQIPYAFSYTKYSYDCLDRLISVTRSGVTTTYTYDAFNRRMAKHSQSEEELFLYQGQDEIGKWINGKCQKLCLLGKNPLSRITAIELAAVP
jgi:YD repeat-containing protein